MAVGETKTRSAVTWLAVGCVGADAGTDVRGEVVGELWRRLPRACRPTTVAAS